MLNYNNTETAHSTDSITWALSEQLEQLSNCPESHLVNKFTCRVLKSYAGPIASLARKYGPLSRAVYLVKYTLACQLFGDYLQVLQSSHRRTGPTVDSHPFELVLNDLKNHFAALLAWAGRDNGKSKKLKVAVDGHSLPVYRYSRIVFERDLAKSVDRIRPWIFRVTKESARQVRPQSVYLYCITREGDLILLNRPLSHEELITGVWQNGVLVKHPFLVVDHELTVRCAGDMWIQKGKNGEVSGILASRASGQFRPDRESLTSIYEMADTVLGLPERSVAVIG